jgi:hypothetical protein
MTIDTLKLARGLQQRGWSREQAEGLAEELRQVTTPIDDLKRDVAILKWMVGINTALIIASTGTIIAVLLRLLPTHSA